MFHTTMAPYGIRPVPNDETRPVFDGAKEGKLMVQKCDGCGFLNFPPATVCGNCKDPDASATFVPVSGKGSIYTWYICHDTSINGFEDKVPYAVICTELDEQPGLILMSNLLNHEYGPVGEGIELGMRVEAVFDKASDDVYMIQFQPAHS